MGHHSAALCHLGTTATRLGRPLNFNPNANTSSTIPKQTEWFAGNIGNIGLCRRESEADDVTTRTVLLRSECRLQAVFSRPKRRGQFTKNANWFV